MTLDKHRIDGIPPITSKTLPAKQFNELLLEAGYTQLGTAPAKGNRIKTWWTHPTYARVEAIYSSIVQLQSQLTMLISNENTSYEFML